MYKKIQIETLHGGQVLKLKLNDGKGNIVDSTMMQELKTAFQEIEERKNLKLILIQGEGKHFSFGASVEEHLPEKAGEMLKGFHALILQIRKLGIATLAMVTGQCLGGGMELALACNFIFADITSKFGQPEIVLGVFPPPASLLLPMRIGSSHADEILLTGKVFDAEEALHFGIINQLFSSREELEIGTEDWIIKNILPKSSVSLSFAVKAAGWLQNENLEKHLAQLEGLYLEQLMANPDPAEGIRAFLEKRKPQWEAESGKQSM